MKAVSGKQFCKPVDGGSSTRPDAVVARMIAARAGAKIDYLPNPRNEAEENNLHVPNDRFLALELESITLGDGLMEEVTDIGGAVSPSRRREGRLSGPQTTRA